MRFRAAHTLPAFFVQALRIPAFLRIRYRFCGGGQTRCRYRRQSEGDGWLSGVDPRWPGREATTGDGTATEVSAGRAEPDTPADEGGAGVTNS